MISISELITSESQPSSADLDNWITSQKNKLSIQEQPLEQPLTQRSIKNIAPGSISGITSILQQQPLEQPLTHRSIENIPPGSISYGITSILKQQNNYGNNQSSFTELWEPTIAKRKELTKRKDEVFCDVLNEFIEALNTNAEKSKIIALSKRCLELPCPSAYNQAVFEFYYMNFLNSQEQYYEVSMRCEDFVKKEKSLPALMTSSYYQKATTGIFTQHAKALIGRNDFVNAKKIAFQIFNDSNNKCDKSEICFYLVFAQNKLEQYDSAISNIDKSLKFASDEYKPKLYLQKAIAINNKKDSCDDALTICEEALKFQNIDSSTKIELHLQQAIAWNNLGPRNPENYRKALAAINEAQQYANSDKNIEASLAFQKIYAYFCLSEYQSALKVFDATSTERIDPKIEVQLWTYRAIIHDQLSSSNIFDEEQRKKHFNLAFTYANFAHNGFKKGNHTSLLTNILFRDPYRIIGNKHPRDE